MNPQVCPNDLGNFHIVVPKQGQLKPNQRDIHLQSRCRWRGDIHHQMTIHNQSRKDLGGGR